MAHDLIGLTDFKIPLNKLSPLESFVNRDGLTLSHRFYSAWSERILIFYHGIGGDSRYVGALASYLAQNNLASVLTPDFRGHGQSHQPVATVVDSESLLNDLQDLVLDIEARYPGKELSIGGHSLGGGFALKAMVHPVLSKYFKSALAFSPYVRGIPRQEKDPSSEWLKLNAEKKQIELQMPAGYKSGSEVLAYSLDYFTAASLNIETDLETLKKSEHLVTIASTGDQLAPSSRYQKIFADAHFHLHVLEGFSHMGQVMSPVAHQQTAEILKKEFLWEPGP